MSKERRDRGKKLKVHVAAGTFVPRKDAHQSKHTTRAHRSTTPRFLVESGYCHRPVGDITIADYMRARNPYDHLDDKTIGHGT